MNASFARRRRQLLLGGLCLPLLALADPRCEPTAQQTEGPFYPEDWTQEHEFDLSRLAGHAERAEGELIVVQGRILDPHCEPIAGAVVDLWQANAKGRYAHPDDRNPAPLDPHFQGRGRVVCDADGRYRFITIKPAPYALQYLDGRPTDAGFRPPHLHFKVSRPGFETLTTQMYFAGDEHQSRDRILARLGEHERERLVVRPRATADAPAFDFDLHLRAG